MLCKCRAMYLCLGFYPLQMHSANFVIIAGGRWFCLSVAYCYCERLSMKSNLLQPSLPSSQRQLFQPKQGVNNINTLTYGYTNFCSLDESCSIRGDSKTSDMVSEYWYDVWKHIMGLVMMNIMVACVCSGQRGRQHSEECVAACCWRRTYSWFQFPLCFNDRCSAPQWPRLNAIS